MPGIVAHDPEFVLEIRSRDLSLYLIHSGEILSLSLCYRGHSNQSETTRDRKKNKKNFPPRA